jgi:prolipoprotein diacylglyceryl transferase
VNHSIPTPSFSVLELGPFAVHAYALCIITGVAIAIWLGNKRFLAAFPDARGVVSDVAVVAVPAGVLGGRLYHVVTTPENFFGENGNPGNILKIWQGGLGIWGAISLGGVGAFLTYLFLARSRSLPQFRYFADAIAPGILLAQAIGRWGNWFNAELFGRPTDLPWALEIPRWARPTGYGEYLTFHPTFLYESLWCLLAALILLRWSKLLHGGQTFALYVALYCLGRLAFESIRIDPAQLVGGVRINLLVSIAVGLSALVIFRRFSRLSR